MAAVKAEKIEIDLEDGTRMSAFVAAPGGRGRRRAILVFQEAYGVNSHIEDVCRRFAREGYVALAPELFHRTAPGFVAAYGDRAAFMPHLQALTIEGLSADIRAAHAALAARKDVAASDVSCIGFCMGGRTAFLAASLVPLKAAVSFYGGNIAPSLLNRVEHIAAPLLMFWGSLDQHIAQGQIDTIGDALRAHVKPFVDVRFSRADHGFFCDQRATYHSESARQAWALTLEFLSTYKP